MAGHRRGRLGRAGHRLPCHSVDQLIEQAIRERGFAVVEAISHCHTQFGRNKLGDRWR